jgi:O-antigen ligase
MLGLGGFLAIISAINSGNIILKWVFALLGIWFASQSALTFSRTGFYLLVLSTTATALLLMKDGKTRLKVITVITVLGLIGAIFIYPMLDNFTGGQLSNRFSETHSSNRTEIALADLAIWQENPILGTGIGRGSIERNDHGFGKVAAHTEYTRLLAEHGTLGLIALVLILTGLGCGFLRQNRDGKAISAGLLIWGLAFLLVSAMRVAAPSFLLALTVANLGRTNHVRPVKSVLRKNVRTRIATNRWRIREPTVLNLGLPKTK